MRFTSLFLLLCTAFCMQAQPLLVDGDVCLDIEVVAIHQEGALAGMTTYRVYATLPGPADLVTTVFGDADNPTFLSTTTSFYQSELGGQFPCANNPILFDAFPELEWDSWLTIGVDGPPEPELGQDCPQVVMSSGSPFMTEFENGNSFVIDDLIATGGTAAATCDLVERLGGRVSALAFVVALDFIPWKDRLTGREVRALLRYS